MEVKDKELNEKLFQIGREAAQEIQELRNKHEKDIECLLRKSLDEAAENGVHFDTDEMEEIIACNERLKAAKCLALERAIDNIRSLTRDKVEEVRHIHTMNTWLCKNDGRAYKFVYLGQPCYRTYKGEIWLAVMEGQLGEWLGTWNPQTNILEEGEEPMRPKISRY